MFGLPYPNREQLLILKTRPMCWLAIGFLVIISSFLLGRSYREPAFESEQQVLLEGRIVQKEYKDSGYGGYWQLTLKQVNIFQGEYGEPAKKGKKDAGSKKERADKGNKAAHVPIESLEGRYLCQISATENADFKIGQLVLVEGRYQSFERPTNPGQFDTKKYYGSLGILGQFKKCKIIKQGTSFSKLLEGLWRLRARTQEFLKQQLGEEKGALISAMLLGEKSGLSREDKNLYRRNGISHILAISGLHLSLLGIGVFKVLKIILADNRQASVFAIIIMSLYCVFTGNSISTIRATIMFALSLLAGICGRSYDSLSALGLSAILQLFWNPYVLYNSGFLLSFLAVIGVTFVAPRLQELLAVKSKFGKSLCVSLSASITTLPVLLRNYGTYPWYSIFLNLLVLPAMSVLLFLAVLLVGVCFLTEGGLAEEVSETVDFLAEGDFFTLVKEMLCFGMEGILTYFESCCKLFERLVGQERYPGAPATWQIVIYVLLAALAVSRIIKHSNLGRIMLLLSAISILTLKIWWGAEITMLDVGQGDCILIRNGNGNVYLSDCGSSSVSQVGKYRLLPFLKQNGYGRIQGIFLSHLDQDHMNGIMELLEMAQEENIKIQYLFLPESVLEGVLREEKERETGGSLGTEEERETDGSLGTEEEQETDGSLGTKEEWENGGDSAIVKGLERLAAGNKITVVYLSQNEVIRDGKMKFTCLYPEAGGARGEDNRNNQSLVLLMKYQDFTMLLTGDLEKPGEKEIVEYLRKNEGLNKLEDFDKEERTIARAMEKLFGADFREDKLQEVNAGMDVLKVAHHGSSGSSCEEFLEIVRPKLALISCGKNNSYGHPHQETLARLEEAGSKVMSTVDSGAITIKLGWKIKVYEYVK